MFVMKLAFAISLALKSKPVFILVPEVQHIQPHIGLLTCFYFSDA